MFGFGGKKERVPQRWLDTARDGVFVDGQRIGAVIPKETYPYALAIMGGPDRKNVLWHAPNYMVAGNRLVTVEFEAAGKDPAGAGTARSRLEGLLSEVAVWRLPLSTGTWLVGSDASVSDLHRRMGEAVGIEHHSFFVVDIMDGRGLGWNAVDGVMMEIEPAQPDTTDTTDIDEPGKLGGVLSCIGIRDQADLRPWVGTDRECYLGSGRVDVRDRRSGEISTETVVVGYGYPKAEVGATALFVMQPDGRTMDFKDMVPAAYVGVRHPMLLEGIEEDDTGLSARLTVRLEDGAALTFSDTQYFRHKAKYAIGERYDFALAALAFRLEPAQRGAPYFSSYVGRAADCARVSVPVSEVASITVNGHSFHKMRATLRMVGNQPIDAPIFCLAANLRGEPPGSGQGVAGDIWLQGFLVGEQD